MKRMILVSTLLLFLAPSLINFLANTESIASATQQQGLIASINNVVVTEGVDAEAVFTVTLHFDGFREFTTFITYELLNETAIAFQDYQLVGGTLVFPPGETPSQGVSMQIAVPILDDEEVEEDETFKVFLGNAIGQAMITGPGTCTIQDNDSTVPTLTILDTEITEGDSGTTDAVFTVRLSRRTDVDVKVDYATQSFGAVEGRDYTRRSGTLTFPSGTNLAEIRVPIIGDTLPERTQGFFVRLSNAIEAVIFDGEGVCSIRDNDAPEKIKACSESEEIEINSNLIVEDMEVGIFISDFLGRPSEDGLGGFSITSPRTFGLTISQVFRAPTPISIGTTCSAPNTEFPDCVFTSDSSTFFKDASPPYRGRWNDRDIMNEEGKRVANGKWQFRVNADYDSFCWCLDITGPREGLRLDPSNAVVTIFAILFPDEEEDSGLITHAREHKVRASLHSNGAPAASVPVTFEVHDSGDNIILTQVIETDETGRAVFEYADYIPGDYTIEARAEVGGAIYTDIARVTWVNPCAVRQSVQGTADAETRLTELRAFRDSRLAKSERGQEYTRLYYKLSSEAVPLMMLNPLMILRSQEMIEKYMPLVRDLSAGKEVTLTEGDLDEIDSFLNRFASKGSNEMRKNIKGLCQDLRNPEVHSEFGITIIPGPRRELPARSPFLSANHLSIGGLLIGACALLVFGFTGKRRKFLKRHSKEFLIVITATSMVIGQAVFDSRQKGISTENEGDLTGYASGPQQAGLKKAFNNWPMRFEANQGQTDPQVKFISRGSGYNLLLTTNEALLSLPDQSSKAKGQKRSGLQPTVDPVADRRSPPLALRMNLVDSNPHASIKGLDELPFKTNYFIGKDSANWHADVPSYSKVQCEDVYDGIDMVYYGNEGRLEYDLIVAPDADPGQIRLRFEGADQIEIDVRGDLILNTASGEVRYRKPLVYQEVNGERRSVDGRYVIREGENKKSEGIIEEAVAHHSPLVAFDIGNYDDSLPLVIDPVLEYSTYLGGIGDDEGMAISADAEGNVYIVGITDSVNLPTMNAAQPGFGGGSQDTFIAKLDPSGTRLIYLTYLGGSDFDNATGLAVDSSGNSYVTGFTRSTNFPAMNAMQPDNRGQFNGFVSKLGPTGNLVYSTYLGGTSNDAGSGIAVDAQGNAYIAGITTSANFPTLNAVQPNLGGASDLYVAKLNEDGSQLIYSTFVGGSREDAATGIAVDPSGNVYVTGATLSTDFRTANAAQPDHGGGISDAFVVKMNPAGNQIIYSTYLGGGNSDRGLRIAADSMGAAYVVGDTFSSNFPVKDALQRNLGGSSDAFIAKLNQSGMIAYSTYLGGSGTDGGTAISTDSTGRAFVTGFTGSIDFPLVAALQQSYGGGEFDAFIARLSASGSALEQSTYLGGSGIDSGFGIAVGNGESIYFMGLTDSVDFPVVNFVQESYGGGVSDLFVAKMRPGPVITGVTIKKAKHLIISGNEFERGAVILLNGEEQKTKFKSTTSLKGKKAALNIESGAIVRLQVRNPDGTASAEFNFTRNN